MSLVCDISGVSAALGPQTSIWIAPSTACLSCDISLSSLGRQLSENKHAIHLPASLHPEPDWPTFSPSLFRCLVPFFPSFFFFSPISWSPPLQAKDPAFSHRARSLKAEPLFPASGKLGREGGAGLSSWLPALARCWCEKKQGRQMWWWQGNCEAKEANSARKLWIYTYFSEQ